MRKILVLLVCSMVSMFACAGDVTNATVKQIIVNKDGTVGIALEGGTVSTAQPSCATSTYPWVASAGAVGTERILSVAMAAKLGNIKVRIVGTGACAVSGHSTREEITWLYFM